MLEILGGILQIFRFGRSLTLPYIVREGEAPAEPLIQTENSTVLKQ
ncbi:MAG: hypothetical protein ACYC27_03330 [Armatimonadota bacterium]